MHGDLTDEEWELIADLVPVFTGNGKIGRPLKHDRRAIIDAILYVAATGCQWRALPERYPPWSTVHRYHLTWSRDGTWEAIADRMRTLVRQAEGHQPDPQVGIVDARSVRGASTVTGPTRGYDAGKKVSGRKCFGIVDSLGLLVGVVVVAANVSDNLGGIYCFERAAPKSTRWKVVFCDGGFKRAPSPENSAATTSKPKSSPRSTPAASRSSHRRAHLVVAHEQPATPNRL